ncbi:MAG: hydroxymethylglutaryl-CoA lyase [Dermatophilaceae bacterium]
MDVRLTDVVLRDGLQDEDVVVSTQDKRTIAAALVAAGVRELEVTSFVSATRIPQMADAEALLATLPRHPGVRICAIALNPRGAQRAVDTRLDELRLVVSAGAGHSRANAGRDTEQALEEFAATIPQLCGVTVTAAVSTAFNCPYDGPVSPSRLLSVVQRFHDLGVRHISLADTLGTASTEQVMHSLDTVRRALPDLQLGLHLHDGHGQALATVDAALRVGVRQFDSALGGLGGCPFAPGAHGNLATEALVAHLHRRDIPTGISEEALADAHHQLRDALDRGIPVSRVTEESSSSPAQIQ